RPAALRRVHDQAALRQCDAGQPAGRDPHAFAVVDGERTQVDVARLEAALGVGGRGRQLHDLLGDPAAWVGEYSFTQLGQLFVGCLRADDEAVAPGRVHRFEDQLVEPGEYRVAHVGVVEAVRVHVRQDRVFA